MLLNKLKKRTKNSALSFYVVGMDKATVETDNRKTIDEKNF
jgi:hypothetical protein